MAVYSLKLLKEVVYLGLHELGVVFVDLHLFDLLLSILCVQQSIRLQHLYLILQIPNVALQGCDFGVLDKQFSGKISDVVLHHLKLVRQLWCDSTDRSMPNPIPNRQAESQQEEDRDMRNSNVLQHRQ